MIGLQQREQGASAVLIASLMVLLLGIAAVAIDLSAGFNERNQDQNAGDNGVMAGTLDLADQQPGAIAVASTLEISAANLTAQFGSQTDPAWVEMWRSCTDNNPGWVPMPEPTSWAAVPTPSNPAPTGTETLDCVSRTTSLFRVRIPDQTVATAFGGVLGVDSIETHAVSIAKLELQSPVPPLIPFGLAGSFGSGESCFGTASPGAVYPPCTAPSSGTFGSLLSEFFGDFYQVPGICGNPESTDAIEIGIALGLDHQLEVWPGASGISVPTAEPGATKASVIANATQHLDECVLDGDDNATPIDGIPINTVVVDSGYPSNEMESGLVSNDSFPGGTKSRLQQGTNPKRDIVKVRNGGSDTIWPLDNAGPWEYLVANTTGIPECQPGHYIATPAIDTEIKVSDFHTCLTAYANTSPALSEDIFSPTIDESPRFVWSPQYTYELPTTGKSFQPIRAFRMSFLAGTFFGCQPAGCKVVFYPDRDFDTEMCDLNPSNLNCGSISLSQFSAWVFPDEAVPQVVQDRFYEAYKNLEPTLWQ